LAQPLVILNEMLKQVQHDGPRVLGISFLMNTNLCALCAFAVKEISYES